MLRIAALDVGDRRHELGDVDAVAEGLERAVRDARGIDQQPQDLSMRSASCTMPRSISARCSSVMSAHRFSSA